MLDFLRRFFQSLFGSDAGQASPEPSAPTKPQTSSVSEPEPAATTQVGPGLWLQRISKGTQDTLGKLYWEGEMLAYTLEVAATEAEFLPAGEYPVALKKEGGRHATYQFRLGEFHEGLIALQETGLKHSPTFHISNTADKLYGSIAMGQSVKDEEQMSEKRELWHSENAYKKVYSQLLPRLKEGPVSLKIADPN